MSLQPHLVEPVSELTARIAKAAFAAPLKQQQWRAFLGKAALRKGEAELAPVIAQARNFLQLPLQALTDVSPFTLHLSPEGPGGEIRRPG